MPVVTGFILTDRGETRKPLAKAGFAFAGMDPYGHIEDFKNVVPICRSSKPQPLATGF